MMALDRHEISAQSHKLFGRRRWKSISNMIQYGLNGGHNDVVTSLFNKLKCFNALKDRTIKVSNQMVQWFDRRDPNKMINALTNKWTDT